MYNPKRPFTPSNVEQKDATSEQMKASHLSYEASSECFRQAEKNLFFSAESNYLNMLDGSITREIYEEKKEQLHDEYMRLMLLLPSNILEDIVASTELGLQQRQTRTIRDIKDELVHRVLIKELSDGEG